MSQHITILARILAEEGVKVVFDKGAKFGAYFDLSKREMHITPGRLGSLNDDELEGATLHEIGHGLFTPKDQWEEFVKKYPDLKRTLNVVEDAREEKLVCEKYPGAYRAFRRFYDSLVLKRNVWGLVDPNTGTVKDLSRTSLVSRINIHFKMQYCGVTVPFAPGYEQDIVNEIANCRTFEEVCDIATRLGPDKGDNNDNKDDIVSDEGGEGDEGDSAEEGGEMVPSSFELTESPLDALEDSLEPGKGKQIATMETVFGPKHHIDMFDRLVSKGLVKFALDPKWFSENNPFVVGMASRFNMKKSARKSERTKTAKSGKIDVDKLVTYRTKFDIFLKSQTTESGKKHGFFILIDLSGSMDDVIASVMEQVVIQVKFFERIGVPYEVYGFTDYYNTNGGGCGLFHFLSSRFSRDKKDLVANYLSTLKYRSAFDVEAKFNKVVDMSGTPLIGALAHLCLIGQVPPLQAFLESTGVEKLTFTLFSDGGATDGYVVKDTLFIDSTYKLYAADGIDDTKSLSYAASLIRRKYNELSDFKLFDFYLCKKDQEVEQMGMYYIQNFKKLADKEYTGDGFDRVFSMNARDREAYKRILDRYVDIVA